MRSVLSIDANIPRPDRPDGFDDDVCFSEDLVELMLEEYTRPGDLVFDPFAGFGTTLAVAERMGRQPLGLEILPERVAFIQARLDDPTAVMRADARRIAELNLPPIDFCMTSPPYMTHVDHAENPLTGYQTEDGDYARYLDELTTVYRQLACLLVPAGRAVINVSNIRLGPLFTPLAWDVGKAILTVLPLENEVVLDWNPPPAWFTNDYCLVFRKPTLIAA
ncbi:MAG TPA: DNA methyltransferase [Actinopolymorphaceae bacterium]|jgi:DNA modification methylase|nr:DNA methyltransferase [Actinopolymorphaceae bacterium]